MVKAVRPPQGAATAASGPAGARDDAPARTSTVPVALLLRSPGVLWRVARCGFVVVAAGVLVTGDLGSPDGASGAGTASASLERPVLSGVSVRAIEVQQRAVLARAESLALADAALRAGAAAQSLTRTPPADDASPDGATPDDATTDSLATGGGLTAERGAVLGLPADRVAALDALESAAQAVSADGLEPLLPVTDPEDDDDLSWGTTDEDVDDPSGGTRPADSPATHVDEGDGEDADDGMLPPAAEPADVGPDATAALDDPLDASGSYPSLDPFEDPADDLTEGPTADGAPDEALGNAFDGTVGAPGTEELDAAVARLEALVRQARGEVAPPSDGGVPADVFLAPSDDPTSVPSGPVPSRATSELALTTALEKAAGAVFALSLRAEGATEAAARAEVVARQEAVSSLAASAQATLAAADALPALKRLSPAELDRLASADEATSAGAGRAPAARQRAAGSAAPRTGASATVADLAARWDNGLLPTDSLCRVDFDPDHLLQCDAAEALGDLNVAYRAHFGADLRLTDSYRTLAGQVAVKAAKPTLAATPGTSNHGWGLAIDVAGAGAVGQFDTPVYLWLKDNAEDFGWHHPRAMEPGGSAPQEPWHWEYKTR